MSYLVQIGNNGIREIWRHLEQDPERGQDLVVTYEGPSDGLQAEAYQVRLGLGHAVVYPYGEGDVYRMDVRYPSDDGYSDSWERVSEFAQEDIKNSPNRVARIGSSDSLNKIIHALQDCIDNGVTLASKVPEIGPITPDIQDLYDQLSRGVTSREVRRIVFRRRRLLPIDLAQGRTPSANEPAYTTGALVYYFGLPALIQALLPATPATALSGTEWLWRVRVDNMLIIPFERKVEEVMEFTFAQWTLLDYDKVTYP